jgi:hypothetical protein
LGVESERMEESQQSPETSPLMRVVNEKTSAYLSAATHSIRFPVTDGLLPLHLPHSSPGG